MHRRKSNRTIENEALYEIIKEVFEEHKGRYGARRIGLVLEKMNIKVNHKRISKIMSKNGLIAKGSRKITNTILKVNLMKKKQIFLIEFLNPKRKMKFGLEILHIYPQNMAFYTYQYLLIYFQEKL